MTMRVELGAACLLKDDYQAIVDSCQAFCDRQGWTFGIQIHNTTSPSWRKTFVNLDVPLSYHAPIGGKYFMNLANSDPQYAQDSVARTVENIDRPAGKRAVFHGFLMTDKPVLSFDSIKSYDECLSLACRDDLSRPGLKLCTDFLAGEEFAQRFSLVKQRLTELHRQHPQIEWCIENDYPANCAGLLLAETIRALDHPLCLDVSHLWIAALLFERDFWQEVTDAADTGLIRCIHFHANTVAPDAKWQDYHDGHRPLARENFMDLPRVARILRDHHIDHWVIESPWAGLDDLHLLADWLT